MAEAPETPFTPFKHPVPGGEEYWVDTPPKNLPTLKDLLLAKFHQDPSSGLDFYREHTHTLLPPGGSNQKTKKLASLKI